MELVPLVSVNCVNYRIRQTQRNYDDGDGDWHPGTSEASCLPARTLRNCEVSVATAGKHRGAEAET
jgi:hypothetical protein